MLILFVFEGFSQRVLLTWDPNPETDIAGYRIYYGTNSRIYVSIIDCGNVTNCVLYASDKPYDGTNYPTAFRCPFIWDSVNFPRNPTMLYFAATAYNTSSLESDLSEEVWLMVPAITTNIVKATIPKYFRVETNP